jgi:hypothetical protein
VITTYAPAGFQNWFLEIDTPAWDLQEVTPPEVTEENMKKAGELAVILLLEHLH